MIQFLPVWHGIFIPSPHILLIMTVLFIDSNQVMPPALPLNQPPPNPPNPLGFNVKSRFITTSEPVDESQSPSMETFSPGPGHFGTGRGPASDPDPEVMGNGTLRLTAAL